MAQNMVKNFKSSKMQRIFRNDDTIAAYHGSLTKCISQPMIQLLFDFGY